MFHSQSCQVEKKSEIFHSCIWYKRDNVINLQENDAVDMWKTYDTILG